MAKMTISKCQNFREFTNMYKNKASNNRNNICGSKLKEVRTHMPNKTSQRQLADMLHIVAQLSRQKSKIFIMN